MRNDTARFTTTRTPPASGAGRSTRRTGRRSPLASESYVDRSGCVDGFNGMCLLIGGNPAHVKVVFDEDAE